MIEKNTKGNIKKLKLDKPNGTTNTKKIEMVYKRQEEIQEVLNYILDTLQTKVRRRTKF